ncbi:nucleoside-diphosphate-sugar epimerase [Frankia casuarinae]|uniref:NAD-dependent epimerase/dehydratase n=1 Tax=Frankia casuarinae (strain DSM 45818 / CECT 9043 / HFP020203 / CcI3) TaxID=106370 RepID=Q2JDH1_FRACC|nr:MULTISPECIES: UDP-glucuronic acid decarboxylase family protein [Frankia]ABD10671.1 NAD-dependent epimerase/dehydratase [Frankia casuarinae]ETA02936.1 nucleoside-diphosphate-sugar epimerase [Frankia sp. CcI6]EYT93426.1 nucleoside-diphosphate-sugar epimerase [Frankia casuarinae]KDA43547.1 nucleoside-diphosphate-sugar epimerase [Frankia sp. BMG5.23]OAA25337.1 dTDP-glucose 4,6-dehydratase [Frankia casuarinae]
MTRRVVVAGGAGFLGSHLCDRLLARGAEVICVDNFLTGRPGNIDHLRRHGGFRLLRRDVTEPIDVTGPVDAVLNFASPASPVDYRALPLETLSVGASGTANLLDLAYRKNARFLLASTSEVYGDPRVHPQPEEYWGHVNPIGPRSMYDEAKRFAEALTTAHRATHGTSTGIIRIFNTYGPRMRADDGRAIPTFIAQALRGQAVTVAGEGRQTRSLCYVDDLVEGVVRMLDSDLPGPVNLGSPQEMTIIDAARLVVEVCGADVPITFVPRPQDDPTVRCPDITLAREALGWRPLVDVRDGLARTVAWFHGRVERPRSPWLVPRQEPPAGSDVLGGDRDGFTVRTGEPGLAVKVGEDDATDS